MARTDRRSWLRALLVDQFANIRRREWPESMMLAGYFFLVIATYWILKPIKRGTLIDHFSNQRLVLAGLDLGGAQAEQVAKILNMFAAFVLMLLFAWLARRWARHHVVVIFATLTSALLVAFAVALDRPSDATVWAFYVFGDMFNTVMVALFWAFTNDIATPATAKRTYGIVGLGGVIGGFVGATVVETQVEAFGRAPLLLICIVPMVAIAVIARVVHRKHQRDRPRGNRGIRQGRLPEALEGARLVFGSSYLIAIAAIIGLYELVSNIIDFQLAWAVEHQIADGRQKEAFFAWVGQIIGIGSILVQLFVTGFVLQRFGVRTGLSVLPLAMLLGSGGFLLVPTLVFAAAMSASDNALNYSINQSSKEALYAPTSPEVTYRAKAFIDMFVQRAGKVISVGLNLALTALVASEIRWLSVCAIVFLVAWLWAVRVAGRQFAKGGRRRKEPGDAEVFATGQPADSRST